MDQHVAAPGPVARLLAVVERLGNRLPVPATLFVLLGAAVLALSCVGAHRGWSVADPRDPSARIAVDNLLDAEGVDRTLGSVLKYREDQDVARAQGLAWVAGA